MIADAAIPAEDGNGRVVPQDLRCQGNAIDDFLIARAATNIVADSRRNLQPGRRTGADAVSQAEG